jgi:membrane-bound lytic murein transglycosylase B
MHAPPATDKEKRALNKSFATLGLLGCLLSLPGHGQPGAGFSQEPEVQAFIIGMHEQHGFDVAHLTRQFAAIHPNATVLRAIRPPAFPEKQRSWQRYRERFVNSLRIGGGLSFWQRHAATLQRAQAIYGVPAEVIVAIIGVETVYGQNMGSFGVLEALASLAFHYPPRAEFFRGELEQFLLLARENGVSPLEIKGSYAGAMGIPQFMPSSQRRFAVDFDGDDRIDLRQQQASTPSAASPVFCSSMAGRAALRLPYRQVSAAIRRDCSRPGSSPR